MVFGGERQNLMALARRPRYALPRQGASSAAKRLSYKIIAIPQHSLTHFSQGSGDSRRAELLRRALPCLASLPLDPPSQTLALARRPGYALPRQGASSAAKRLSYKNAAEFVILHIESCVLFL